MLGLAQVEAGFYEIGVSRVFGKAIRVLSCHTDGALYKFLDFGTFYQGNRTTTQVM